MKKSEVILKGFTVFTTEVKKTVGYYKKLLRVQPEKESDMAATFRINGITYFIHKSHEKDPNKPPSEDHMELIVDNVDQKCKKLVEQGFSIEFKPKRLLLGKICLFT